MFISAGTLDDLLRKVFERALRSKTITRSRRSKELGPARELSGILLHLTNPRARLSRTETRGYIFSCLGELLWYLAGSDSLRFITYYIKRYKDESRDRITVGSAYGPRLFGPPGPDQVAAVLNLLRERADSRRAVIQLLRPDDLLNDKLDPPCTCTLQFLVRRGRLHMFTCMRSNDVYLGLTHDIFSFTMLQELLARSLGIELGGYKHAVGSLHLYEKHEASAREFLGEGWQPTIDASMPPMPIGDPWPAVETLLEAEHLIRTTGRVDTGRLALDPYWLDLVRLLQIFWHSKTARRRERDRSVIAALKRGMSSRSYDEYIDRRRRPPPRTTPPDQQSLL